MNIKEQATLYIEYCQKNNLNKNEIKSLDRFLKESEMKDND